MKRSLKLTALALLLSSGVFAAAPGKSANKMMSKQDEIVFYTLPSQRGIDLRIKKAEPGRTTVTITDMDGNVLQRDVIKKSYIRRGYNLTELDPGDYKIRIASNNGVFERTIHIYYEYYKNPVRTFIVEQV